MDRSQRGGTKRPRLSGEPAQAAPPASRLTVRPRRNRRRPLSLWSRVPAPGVVADACGRALRRSLPTLIAGAVILLVGTGVYLGHRFVTTSPRFAIRSIEVHGEDHLSEQQIRAAISARVGDNVFATSLDRLTRELRATPWIASATAHRRLPDTVVIEVREHAPAALVDLGGLYLVDRSGHPFKLARVEAGDGQGLPVITGFSRDDYDTDPAATARLITDALAALRTWSSSDDRPTIGEVHVGAHREVTLRTYERALAVELGELDADPSLLAARLETFDSVWAALAPTERDRVTAIHLASRVESELGRAVTVALAKE